MAFGLIRKIQIGSRTRTTVARASRSTPAKPGRHKIISRQRSSITLLWTMHSLTTFTVRSRTTRTLASPAVPIGARLGPQIGLSRVAANPASSCPIRATGTSFIQTMRVTLGFVTIKAKKRCRTSVPSLSIMPDTGPSMWPIVSSGFRRLCCRHTTRTCSTRRRSAFSNRPITARAGPKSAAI